MPKSKGSIPFRNFQIPNVHSPTSDCTRIRQSIGVTDDAHHVDLCHGDQVDQLRKKLVAKIRFCVHRIRFSLNIFCRKVLYVWLTCRGGLTHYFKIFFINFHNRKCPDQRDR